MGHPFMKEFTSAKLWDRVNTPYAREQGDLIILMRGASEKFRKFFQDKIKADRLKTRGD
jgi:hypothetical protein